LLFNFKLKNFNRKNSARKHESAKNVRIQSAKIFLRIDTCGPRYLGKNPQNKSAKILYPQILLIPKIFKFSFGKQLRSKISVGDGSTKISDQKKNLQNKKVQFDKAISLINSTQKVF